MAEDDFLQLQELQRNSGLSLMKYLQEIDLSYSTYNYWKQKLISLFAEYSYNRKGMTVATIICALSDAYIQEVIPKVVAIAVNTVMMMLRIFPQMLLFSIVL